MSQVILLEKGERIPLSKAVSKFYIGLGWKPAPASPKYDLDVTLLPLTDAKKVPNPKFFVYYGNLETPDKFITRSADSLDGEQEGDDEKVYVDFSKLTEDIKEILIVVTIHKASERNHNFGMVQDSYIRICTNEGAIPVEQARFDLTEDYSTSTAVTFGRLYLHNGEWKFQAVGTGEKSELQKFVDTYC